MAEQQWQRHSRRGEKPMVDPEGQRSSLGASWGLHEEVIRKNNEIIRNFLSKLNEVFTRQEQYEAGTKAIHEKLAKLTQTSESLQFDLRSTYLETSRQQSQLANDIAVVKNALKIPSLAIPHEAYLASDFFRERVNGVNSRVRDHCGRAGRRQRTNFGESEGTEKGGSGGGSRVSVLQQPIFSNQLSSPSAVRHTKNWSELPPKQPEQQLSKTTIGYLRHSEDSLQHLSTHVDISPLVEELREKLEGCATKTGLESSLSLLREELQSKLESMLADRKSECDWNHIDFDELQNYIDTKVEEALADKVGKKYFEASMTNLKEAWEQEEKNIYEAIALRAEGSEVAALREKVAELTLKLQHPLYISPKPSTTLLNATLSPFLGKHAHHRVSARDMHHSDSPDTTLIARREEERRKSRANLQYTNSLSLCRSVDKKDTKAAAIPNNVFEELMVSQGMLKERVWREKVSEALGEEKIKKKTKIMN